MENEGLGSWQIGGNQQPTHGRRAQQVLPDEDVGSPYVPKQVMSKADLKKLQWEKERGRNKTCGIISIVQTWRKRRPGL